MIDEQTFLALCQQAFKATRYSMTQEMNMAELVKQIAELTVGIAKSLLQSRLEEDPRRNPASPICHQCQNRLRIQEPAQRRVLKTALGEVEYQRAYGVCDRCGHTAAPLDEALGISVSGPSVDARHKICHAAVVGRSFEDGREILNVHSKIEISAKHVRSIAEQEGRDLAEQRSQEVAAYQQGNLSIDLATVPALLVIAADGGRVQTRAREVNERWKEDKIGVVYDAVIQPKSDAKLGEYLGAKAQTKTYVATMENWESAGWMLRVEAERRGYTQAKTKLFIADGARSIRELKNLQFPEAVFILDWAHAVQHLSDCSKAFFGEGCKEAVKWYAQHKQMLWDGQTDRIIQDLRRLSKRLGMPKEGDPERSPRRILHQNAHCYFPDNQEAVDYPRFRREGWPIGSGVAEGSVKQFAIRLKGSEKFWNRSHMGAEEMLTLCALYHSEDGRWDRHWHKRAQPR